MAYKTLLTFKKINSKEQVEAMLAYTIPEYADMLYDGAEVTPKDKAREMADKQLNGLLPNHEVNEPHEVYFMHDNDKHIGFIWFEKRPMTRELFLQYIGVFPEYRRHGYAQLGLNFVEMIASQQQARTCSLTVLRHNLAAVNLYKNNGYMTQPDSMLPPGRKPTRYRMYKIV